MSGPQMFVGDPVHVQPGTPGVTKAEMTGVTVLQSRQTTQIPGRHNGRAYPKKEL